MKFNEKLIKLRKEKGMTQEDVAFEIGVSRQSVSKWEQGEFEPDLTNLRALSQIFGVSLDYLVGNESERLPTASQQNGVRRVGMEESQHFLNISKKNAPWIALGVLLCILSPVTLLLLGGMSEIPSFPLSENVAAGIGMIVLLTLVAIAVAIFIVCGSRTAPYKYLEQESFQIDEPTKAQTQEFKENYRKCYVRNNVIGVCLCILSIVPLFIGVMIDENNDFLLVCLLCALFFLTGVGVFLFVLSGVIWGSYEKILQEEEYSKQNKEKSPLVAASSFAYWLVVTAIFLCVSFFTNKWKYTWLIWVIAGILYPALVLLINAQQNPKNKK